MLLMVSVQNLPEALQALKGGADIVDVKNLQEALVGSAHPTVVKQVRDAVPGSEHASVTLGVVPNQSGTVAMAAYTAGVLDATSVKVGFMKSQYDEAVEILLDAKKALEAFNTKLIGSLFADNLLYDGLDARYMNQLAKAGQCDGWLIDTLTKDGRNLFDFVPEAELKDMVMEGKEAGMSTALSGHLKLDDLDELARVNPDIVGVRGAVCSKGDRNDGVYWEAVDHFRQELRSRERGEIDVRDGMSVVSANGADGWIVIDGNGKTCAGIISALSDQIAQDDQSFVEVIIPDVLNTYDVIVWAEKESHKILTRRKDASGAIRMLIQP